MHVRHGSNWCQLTWKFMFPLAAVLLSCLSNVLTDTAFFSVFWWAYIRTFSHVEWSMEKASRFQISLTFPSLILFVHYKKLYTHKKWPYSVVPWLMSPPKKQKKPISGYLTFLFIYSLYSIERKFEHQTNFFQHLYFRCELEILFWTWGEFFFLTIGHREALQSC